jgi:pimeloyl-ACP methyl ester carboxylesterase
MENTDAPALLLLPGFGVGSFHYDQQLRDLGREYRLWAVDFLGQGKSWPSHDPAPDGEQAVEEVLEGQAKATLRDWGFGSTPEPWARELVYSVDTWQDQVHAFIEKVR